MKPDLVTEQQQINSPVQIGSDTWEYVSAGGYYSLALKIVS
jgi:hypothetical protein